jgi:mono/diheme cytochrome c family protein
MTHRSILATIAVFTAVAGATLAISQPAKTQSTAKEIPKAAVEPVPAFDKTYLSNAANIKAGQAVWANQCRHCHGNSAYPGKAPKLNPGGMDPEFIFDRVTNGFGKMPGWKEVFSLEQRKGVVAYMKSDSFSP